MLGAATAAHQVEGNNIYNDYWVQEQVPHSIFNEPSLDAVDHYNRYEEDIRLMAKHADKEGNPLYPVPKLMNRKELEAIYYAVKE